MIELQIEFVPATARREPVIAVLAGSDLAFGPEAGALVEMAGGHIAKAAEAAGFTGKARTHLELLALARPHLDRLVVVGLGDTAHMSQADWVNAGGQVMGLLAQRKTEAAGLVADAGDSEATPAAEIAADLALGALLRSYRFEKYRTKRANGDDAGPTSVARLAIHCADPDAARAAFERRRALAEGVSLARDLVNEPANMLGPVEFAERTRELRAVGVEVEILEPERLAEIGMGALLAVAQGSTRPARVVVMRWSGARNKRAKKLCVIGKGVCFDTGGISIKPAQGMEDMKGDMAGAACVVGLMHALGARKAKVNAVGIVGLVENMPSGTAIRPGDIVTSLSGQTVEILNTDAEGRLVLADLLTYAVREFEPKLMVNLATLTGAIMVALGKEHAGLFSNDDKLAEDLIAAGKATGEHVWRMPLAKAYDKLLDSRNADMKNIGGRFGGAITAAQFLQRFVGDTPWAHLDIAGVGMDSNKTEISQGWASGWGVRLLDQMIAERHEK